MSLWIPWARSNPGKSGGSFAAGYAKKLVCHTTETDAFHPGPTFYGKHSWPHWTCERDGDLWQHIDGDLAARALKNVSGGVETNRGGAWQVECVARAANGDNALTAAQVATLRRLVVDLHGHGLAYVALPAGAIEGSARASAPQRMTADQWRRFGGICGHRHVPENDHWDPGAFDLRRLLPSAAPAPPAPPEETDEMGHVIQEKETGRVMVVAGNTRTHAATLAHVDELVAAKLVAPYVAPLPQVSVAALDDLFPELPAA